MWSKIWSFIVFFYPLTFLHESLSRVVAFLITLISRDTLRPPSFHWRPVEPVLAKKNSTLYLKMTRVKILLLLLILSPFLTRAAPSINPEERSIEQYLANIIKIICLCGFPNIYIVIFCPFSHNRNLKVFWVLSIFLQCGSFQLKTREGSKERCNS